MTIQVTGDNDIARALRLALRSAGYAVSESRGGYAIHIESGEDQVTVYGADSDFERHAINCITNLTGSVLVCRDRHRDDKRLDIAVPEGESLEREVVTGLLRAVMKETKHGQWKPTLWNKLRGRA